MVAAAAVAYNVSENPPLKEDRDGERWITSEEISIVRK